MAKVQQALIITEAVLGVLLMAGILIQTPKASGLGGTIGGGGDGSGGGYRTRRGLEPQIYWTTWGLTAAFLVCSLALLLTRTPLPLPPFPPPPLPRLSSP